MVSSEQSLLHRLLPQEQQLRPAEAYSAALRTTQPANLRDLSLAAALHQLLPLLAVFSEAPKAVQLHRRLQQPRPHQLADCLAAAVLLLVPGLEAVSSVPNLLLARLQQAV